MRSFLLAIISILLLLPDLPGQEWIVPDDKKSKLCTSPFDDATRKAGEKLYIINCMSCHGTPGKANFLNLIPPPGDPATEKIQINNDGELFYKVTIGKGQMPSFKSVLSSNEIWHIISFLRSFNSSYKQQLMPIITSSAYPGAIIKITLSFNMKDSTIALYASAANGKSVVPVTEAEVIIFVHRTFGLIQIDDAKTTGKEGIAIFKIPRNLPGDTEGNILVNARFTNEEIFGSVSKDTLLVAAKKTIPVSLVAERAMWNNIRKAPVWIILIYSIGVLGALGFIFYVLMKLRDIYVIGETITTDFREKEN